MGNVLSDSGSKFRPRADSLLEQAGKNESGSDAQRHALANVQRLMAEHPECMFDSSGAYNIFLSLCELGDVDTLVIALTIVKCASCLWHSGSDLSWLRTPTLGLLLPPCIQCTLCIELHILHQICAISLGFRRNLRPWHTKSSAQSFLTPVVSVRSSHCNPGPSCCVLPGCAYSRISVACKWGNIDTASLST